MVDEAKVRAALEQEADAVELPGRVWEKVRTARPGRPGFWARFRLGRAVEAVAVCAVLAGLVAVGAYRANHKQQAPAGKHDAAVTLPAALTVKEIESVEVRLLSAGPQTVLLRPDYLAKIVNVYNQASKQVRPRTVPANADYSIGLHLTSGKVLSFGVAKGQSLMADYDGAAFWVDSRDLADVLNGADTLLRREDVPLVGFTAADVMRVLQESGLEVALGGEIPESTSAFGVKGQALRVAGQSLQVYVYDSEQAQQRVTVSQDGYRIGLGNGDVQVEWVARPHFIRRANIIVTFATEQEELAAKVKQAVEGLK